MPTKKKAYLWDTGALSLYFADHQQAKEIMKDVQEEKATGYIPNLVLIEFFYKQAEKMGIKTAEHRIRIIRDSKNLEVRLEQDDIQEVGLTKLKYRNLSMVDCVISVLSRKYNTYIVTTDGDFNAIEKVKSLNMSY